MAATVEGTICETVESTREYISALTELLKQLETVESQVKVTAAKSKSVIDHHFPYVVGAITSLLDQRQLTLQKEVLNTRDEALKPLEECRQFIQNKLNNAELVIHQGDKILQDHNVPNEDVITFCDKASLLGSLPEIPNPTNVANIVVNFEEKILTGILSSLKAYGTIKAYCPVQICMAESYPGALLLQWIEQEDENAQDASHFRLQYCQGNVYKQFGKGINYKDLYEGSESTFLVRNLESGQPYSFRISCYQGDIGNEEWSDWSPPYIATTISHHYEWGESEYYLCTNNSRIATRIAEGTSGIIISKLPLNKCHHSIRFRILEIGLTANIDEGLALLDISQNSTNGAGFGQNGTVFINIQGSICVGSKEMTSRLPPLKRGCSVTFDLQPLAGQHNRNKIRVTIESGEQQIICDFNIGENFDNIYYAMFFRCKGWKVEVD